MPFGYVAGAVISYAGQRSANRRANRAANAQAAANVQAQQDLIDASDKVKSYYEPMAEGYDTATADLATREGDLYRRATSALDASKRYAAAPLDVNSYMSPATDLAIKKATEAVAASGAAAGNLRSGGTIRSVADRATELATAGYDQAFARADADRRYRSGLETAPSALLSPALQLTQRRQDTASGAIDNLANNESSLGANLAASAVSGGNIQANRIASQKSNAEILGGIFNQGVNSYNSANSLANGGSGGNAYSAIGNAISGFFTSDGHMKFDVKHLTADDFDDFAEKVPAVSFEYKEEVGDGDPTPGTPKAGVIAQSLEKTKVGKGMVVNTPNGKAVDTGMATSALLAMTSDLTKRVKKLEKK